MRGIVFVCLSLFAISAMADPMPKAAKEMGQAVVAANKALGLESYPPPHCLSWGIGHEVTPDQVQRCATEALQGLSSLGKDFVLAVLMSQVGPQTVIAVALDAPGWVSLSCDPGKACPPRHAGTDKMGKRVVDRLDRACKNATTLWFPERKGCP